ncbi:MAG: 16S rRNA (guanine(966)-N(2))-methyltransferase RsmD [Sneathiella sp.]|nr:MAG: 16S rRNA (guanine(966)-N(2))-methyltransferase RsmD [Sneathiella sp.]
MRIVGGEFRGKKLILPDDTRIRPTSDRTREALFNILGHDSHFRTPQGALPLGARVLDIFAGTGALGLEALSRGAAHVTFIDNHPDSLKLIRENVSAIGAARQADVLSRNGSNPGRAGATYDLILMDPPYNEGLAPQCISALKAGGWMSSSTVIVIELAAKETFDLPPDMVTIKERKYGAARLIFLKSA